MKNRKKPNVKWKLSSMYYVYENKIITTFSNVKQIKNVDPNTKFPRVEVGFSKNQYCHNFINIKFSKNCFLFYIQWILLIIRTLCMDFDVQHSRVYNMNSKPKF